LSTLALDKELILGPIGARTDEAAIRKVARALRRAGYVTASYTAAVLAREREFPTGLPTEGAGVAIPHCDAGHVIRPTVACATLVHPVKFGLMAGEDGESVDVDIILMLAIQDPQEQLDVLKRVCTVVQDRELLVTLKAATDKDQVLRILERVFAA
jgi:galactitol PTS system EIIA component